MHITSKSIQPPQRNWKDQGERYHPLHRRTQRASKEHHCLDVQKHEPKLTKKVVIRRFETSLENNKKGIRNSIQGDRLLWGLREGGSFEIKAKVVKKRVW